MSFGRHSAYSQELSVCHNQSHERLRVLFIQGARSDFRTALLTGVVAPAAALLEHNQPIVPVNTHIRMISTSANAAHRWRSFLSRCET